MTIRSQILSKASKEAEDDQTVAKPLDYELDDNPDAKVDVAEAKRVCFHHRENRNEVTIREEVNFLQNISEMCHRTGERWAFAHRIL